MDLNIDEAIKRLPNKEEIHTFDNSCGFLLGADWSREELIKAIKAYGGAELTGEAATLMNHGMAIEYEDDWLFIETVDNEVNQEPQSVHGRSKER